MLKLNIFYKLAVPEWDMFREWIDFDIKKIKDFVNKENFPTYKIYKFSYGQSKYIKDWKCECIENCKNFLFHKIV